jgi:hypothetical protein
MKPLIDFGDHDSLERLNSRKFATFCNKGGKQLMERYCSLCKVTAEGENVDSYRFSLPAELPLPPDLTDLTNSYDDFRSSCGKNRHSIKVRVSSISF